MKTSIHLLPLVTLILALLTGCASPQKGLKAVVSLGLSVERAMTTAGKLHRAGQLSDASRDKIVALYDEWLPLYDVALTFAEQFPGAAPGEQFTDATKSLLDAASAAGVPAP